MATFVMDCPLVVQGVVVQLVDSAIRWTNPRKNNMGQRGNLRRLAGICKLH